MSNVKRGWSSEGLPVIEPDDDRYWSTADAARLLGPPELTQGQVRQLVALASIPAIGKRRVTIRGRGGRHVRVYEAAKLIKAYEAVASVIPG